MNKVLNENKAKAIISSIIILLPMIVGLFLWNKLPDSMVIHWGADSNADGFGSKAFAVFVLPMIMLVLHWLGLIMTAHDSKNDKQNKKVLGLIFWIIPIITLITSGFLYVSSLGGEINIDWIIPAMLGVMFIIFGNYFPKTKQNSTIGIRVPWTLNNEENWNKTHRFIGKLWVGGGLIILCSLLFPFNFAISIMPVVLIILAIAPILYSYMYYKKQLKNGEYKSDFQSTNKTASKASTAFLVIILAFVGFIMFTGNISFQVGEDGFSINASYYSDITIKYDHIDSIEFRENCDPGYRSNGFGSPRLSMGTFKNNEFGSYTRYTYTKAEACILIKNGDNTLVIGDKNKEETKKLYEELKMKINREK